MSNQTTPPAADTVVNATKTEREIQLESELETERKARKKAETDASYAQDEARRLKEIPSSKPTPPKRSWGFFHEKEV